MLKTGLSSYALMLVSLLCFACAPIGGEPPIRFLYPEPPNFDGQRPIDQAREYGDVLRSQDPDFLEAINDPSLTSVTRKYGLSVINTRKLPWRSSVARARVTPWSSWWFPKRETSFFDDSRAAGSEDFSNLSTLSKFDLVKKMKDPDAPSAASFERSRFRRDALSWEGLCDAWSIASISFPEPQRPVTVRLSSSVADKVTFNISDLKGLLLKTLEAVDDSNFEYFGQKFTGQETAWIYPDLFPEQFHRLVEVQLFERGEPFIMDIDPGVEIWNYPAYKANYLVSEIPGEPNAVLVRTWIYFADSLKSNDKSFIGTKEIIREYDYVLQGDRNANGDLVVTIGYWVKGPTGVNSRHDHPDFILIPPGRGEMTRKSWNPHIDIETVDEILSRAI